jgi:amino-acid N-acetyltransferase
VHTRPATPSDAAAIEALIDLYVPSGTLLPRSAAFIASHAHDFIVAVPGSGDDETIVGCVHLDEYAPSLAEIRSLAVAPGNQGGGVGVALVTAAESLARKRSLATLFAVSNTGAFFERLGYEARHIPELDRERSAVSKFKGVYAKDLGTA